MNPYSDSNRSTDTTHPPDNHIHSIHAASHSTTPTALRDGVSPSSQIKRDKTFGQKPEFTKNNAVSCLFCAFLHVLTVIPFDPTSCPPTNPEHRKSQKQMAKMSFDICGSPFSIGNKSFTNKFLTICTIC